MLPTTTNIVLFSPGGLESSSPVAAAHSIPNFQHPSHSLLKANGFQQQQYYKYRHKCLKGTSQRKQMIGPTASQHAMPVFCAWDALQLWNSKLPPVSTAPSF